MQTHRSAPYDAQHMLKRACAHAQLTRQEAAQAMQAAAQVSFCRDLVKILKSAIGVGKNCKQHKLRGLAG